jgi:hypothetical protein
MITNNPGHLNGFNYVGLHRYSLTFCTDRRRRLFTDGAAVELVVKQLLRAANEQKFSSRTLFAQASRQRLSNIRS